MPSELIEFWQDCDLSHCPFVHPKDIEILRSKGRCLEEHDSATFESYVASERFGGTDSRFHLSLLPTPYLGDLRNAEIVILMLNPGFDYSDYWAEKKVPEVFQRLKANLTQSFDGVEFPFLFLDPQLCFHSGFMWWEAKLRNVLERIAERKFAHNYLAALQSLSTKLACVELVPYHSRSFNDHKIIDDLPSVNAARRFVLHSLVPEAALGKRTIIAMRQRKVWGLRAGMENVVVYEGGHTRGASLGTNSEGGKAILKHFA